MEATAPSAISPAFINDWSARDIQAFEYQPLGPFLGKSRDLDVTVGRDDRCPAVPPAPAPSGTAGQEYLHTEAHLTAFDLHLDPARVGGVRDKDIEPVVAAPGSRTWTAAQQLAHLTVNGANVEPGDLFASGTVPGSARLGGQPHRAHP